MAHWAEINQDNVVVRVVVGDNNDPNGDEGYQWLLDNLGGRWVKTSYNAATNGYRKNFAGTGCVFDESRDAFITPKANCHPEEILDEDLCQWVCSNAEHQITL